MPCSCEADEENIRVLEERWHVASAGLTSVTLGKKAACV